MLDVSSYPGVCLWIANLKSRQDLLSGGAISCSRAIVWGLGAPQHAECNLFHASTPVLCDQMHAGVSLYVPKMWLKRARGDRYEDAFTRSVKDFTKAPLRCFPPQLAGGRGPRPAPST